MALPIALNRVVPFSDRTHKTSIDHLPDKFAITFRIGQLSMQVYFSKFSVISNAYIFNDSNFCVTALRYCNVLHD